MLLLKSSSCLVAVAGKVRRTSDYVTKDERVRTLKSSSQCGRELVLKPDDLGERKSFEMAGPLIVHMFTSFKGVYACWILGTLRQVVHSVSYGALLFALSER